MTISSRRVIPRGVKNPLATLRNVRWSGGSIEIITRIWLKGFDSSAMTSIWSLRNRMMLPAALENTSGCDEISVMWRCFVIAQNGCTFSASVMCTGSLARSHRHSSYGKLCSPYSWLSTSRLSRLSGAIVMR